MRFFVNERSLHTQFDSIPHFIQSLHVLHACSRVLERHRYRLYCTRTIPQRAVTPTLSFREAVSQSGNRDLIRVVMQWLDRNGPFWQDDQQHNPDEYFTCLGHVVTEGSLAEAAFCSTQGQHTAMVSFDPSDFMIDPLEIIWWHSDVERTTCAVRNCWQVEKITDCIVPPQSTRGRVCWHR